jgi:predicted AlkP superfamily phosphohydrolase/phosphomutase
VSRLTTLVLLVVVNLIAVVLLWPGSDQPEHASGERPRVFILGCDGMDPVLAERLMDEGRLPNMAKLRAQGGFAPLTTSMPPQSPVAWSNFITGAGPGVHGIFDFIHRDPNTTPPLPYFSTSRIEGESHIWQVPGTDYVVESGDVKNVLQRKGTPFWAYLDEAGIHSDFYRLPANYPPTESEYGNVRSLPGMGVPDVFASQGTYQHFTSRPRRERDLGGGRQMQLKKDPQTGDFIANLRGPQNTFLKPAGDSKSPPYMLKKVKIERLADQNAARLTWSNEALEPWAGGEQVLELKIGKWSDWVRFDFLQTPVGPTFPTMARILVQSIKPDIDVYFSPLNFVASESYAPISEPSSFLGEIGAEVGEFYTQGFAEDFKARDHDVLTDEDYAHQANLVMEERLRLLDYALRHYEDGLLFFYFSSSDLQAHIFWWTSDDPHPFRSFEDAQKYNAVVTRIYERIDEALGRALDWLGEDTVVMVMSDHGFNNFGRGVGLATWLRDEGYLVAQRGTLIDCDWSQTRAYTYGLNGIYLNLKGREKAGIVAPEERDALLNEISDKLMQLHDPDNGRRVVERVYRTDEFYQGAQARRAPDLLVGFAKGYRASWNTGLGDFDKAVVIPNKTPGVRITASRTIWCRAR